MRRFIALSFSFWFLAPCGVGTGVLSLGDRVLVGAREGGGWGYKGGCGFCTVSSLIIFHFFLLFFSSPFLGAGKNITENVNINLFTAINGQHNRHVC